ncbi:DUF2061 domain-containing protein [Patescibacteria group bacterium]|nr:DUF2061 domain-containing protein [Patescibacteria group bacterium]MBU1705175.1 DUF2061 domain-containing protein [Patescibacteria group bacterium]
MDSHRRSIVKAISWRMIASLTTFALVYLFTGEITLSVQVGILDVVLKMIFYYGHERVWNKINYGITAKKAN